MLYQGSKAELGKHIAPIIEYYRPKNGITIEPFCGGLNMTQHLMGRKYCSDANKYLIAMWKAVLSGWNPPERWDEAFYKEVRDNVLNYPEELVGWIGFCTFGGGFFNGFRHPTSNRDFTVEYRANILAQKEKLNGVYLRCCNYAEVNHEDNSVYYCDPPYADTKEYLSSFQSWQFWEWCRERSKQAIVLVSEYKAPSDFKWIWLKQRTSTMKLGEGKQDIEKLFIHESHFIKRFL